MTTTETGVGTTVRRPPCLTVAVCGFFTCMGGVHIGLGPTRRYRSFADEAFFGLVRTGWAEVSMAVPTGRATAGPGPSPDSGRRAVPPYP